MDRQSYLKIIPGHDGQMQSVDVETMKFEAYDGPLQDNTMLVIEDNSIEMGGPFMGYSPYSGLKEIKKESAISQDTHTTVVSPSHTVVCWDFDMNSERDLDYDEHSLQMDINEPVIVELFDPQLYAGDRVEELFDVKPAKWKPIPTSTKLIETNGTVEPEGGKRGRGRPRGSRNKPGGNIKEVTEVNGSKRGVPSKKAAVEEVVDQLTLIDVDGNGGDSPDSPEPVPPEYLKIKPKQLKSQKKTTPVKERETASYREKRLKNTIAAKNCREKGKRYSDQMKSRLQYLEPAYVKLKSDYEKLEKAYKALQEK